MNGTSVRRALLGSVAIATLALSAACGGDDMAGMDHGAGTATGASSAPASSATFNDADVQFAQMMIVHHQEALDMAAMAETKATDPEVKKIAGEIKNAQDPEIKTMTGWLTSWGQPTSMPSGHNMEGMSSMPGSMSEEDMTKLEAATGAEFDREFTRMMIEHHKGAIEMAQQQTAGTNPDAKALAATIEKAQTAEVATLQKILDRL